MGRPKREGVGPKGSLRGPSSLTDQARYSGGTHGDTGPAGGQWGQRAMEEGPACVWAEMTEQRRHAGERGDPQAQVHQEQALN